MPIVAHVQPKGLTDGKIPHVMVQGSKWSKWTKPKVFTGFSLVKQDA